LKTVGLIGAFATAVIIVVLATELGPAMSDVLDWIETGRTGGLILPLAIANIVLFAAIVIYLFKKKM